MADHWTGANYVTLALSGPVRNVICLAFAMTLEELKHDKADLLHPRGTTQNRYHFDPVVLQEKWLSY